MGSKYLEYPSAGALGCISASFTAGTGWRRRKAKEASFECDVESYLNLLWKFLKPVSFSLIGKEVDFQVLEGNMLLLGFLTLFVGVVFRLTSGYLSFCGGNFNWKERAYITLSGFPKATGTSKKLSLCSWCLLLNIRLHISKFTFFFCARKFSSSCSWTGGTRFGTLPNNLQWRTAFVGTKRSSDLRSGNHIHCSIR